MKNLCLSLRTITGELVTVPDPSVRFVHLQFRRFAGCPICNAHLRSFVKNKARLDDNGIREVVFFHSSATALLRYAANLPFDVVADPEKKFYRQFGVESSPWSLFHPSIFGAIVRGAAVVFRGEARRLWMPKVENGRLGLPADFLVDRSGRVVATKRGRHAYDQWGIDELLDFARQTTKSRSAPNVCLNDVSSIARLPPETSR